MRNDVQEIKDRLDIVTFIQEYLQLKPAGANWRGLCPFHHEKSPSFMAHREKQMWHCFGCGEGGDIFSFLMKIEGLEFPEALRILAERAGVELTPQSREATNERTKLQEIITVASNFYSHTLQDHPDAAPARDYLKTRQLKPETIQEFGIGFALDAWDSLAKFMTQKGYGVQDLINAGLIIKKEGGGFYDRFRGRIMFPIHDVHGKPVGFTGRVLVETAQSGGKYVNTPQTALYDKSRVVYNLHRAKQYIKDAGAVILMEGQMDVITAYQNDIKNVVATSGTALTIEQIHLIKRYTTVTYLAFDADLAGESAAKKGIRLMNQEDFDLKVIVIPPGQGKDPDECIKQSRQNFIDAVENAQPVIQFIINKALRGKDVQNPRDKETIVREALPEILALPSAVMQETWIHRLAALLAVSESAIMEEAKRWTQSQISGKERLRQTATTPTPSATPHSPGNQPKTRTEVEQELLALALAQPFVARPYLERLHPAMFVDEKLRQLYMVMRNLYTTSIPVENFTAVFDAAWKRQGGGDEVTTLHLFIEHRFAEVSLKQLASDFLNTARRFCEQWAAGEREEVAMAIRAAEERGDRMRTDELIVQYQQLNDFVNFFSTNYTAL